MAEDIGGTIRISGFKGNSTLQNPWAIDPRMGVDGLTYNTIVHRGSIYRRPSIRRAYNTELTDLGVSNLEGANYSQGAFLWQTSTGGALSDVYSQDFESLTAVNLDTQDSWAYVSGPDTLRVKTDAPIPSGSKAIWFDYAAGGGVTKYARTFAAQGNYEASWQYMVNAGAGVTTEDVAAASGANADADQLWRVRTVYAGASAATFSVTVYDPAYAGGKVLTATYAVAIAHNFRVKVSASGTWSLSIDGVSVYTGSHGKAASVSTIISGTSTTATQVYNFYTTSPNHTFSHVADSGSNRFLVVNVTLTDQGTDDPNAPHDPISTVTYGGTAMTRAGSTSGFGRYVATYYLIAPTAGTANVVVTFVPARKYSAGGRNIGVVSSAHSFTGVHQTTPLRTAQFGGDIYGAPGATLPFFKWSSHSAGSWINIPSSTYPFPLPVPPGPWGGSTVTSIPAPAFSMITVATQPGDLVMHLMSSGLAGWRLSTSGLGGINYSAASTQSLTTTQTSFYSKPSGYTWGDFDTVIKSYISMAPAASGTMNLLPWLTLTYNSTTGDDWSQKFTQAAVVLVPASAPATVSTTDRIHVVGTPTGSGHKSGTIDFIKIQSFFPASTSTQIFVIQGGKGGTTPRLLRGDATDINTAWTVVGNIANAGDTSVFAVPFANAYYFPCVPQTAAPMRINSSWVIADVGGSPVNFSDAAGLNRMLWSCITGGKLQFSAIDGAESYLSSDTVQLGDFTGIPSALHQLQRKMIAITEKGLFSAYGYGRASSGSEEISRSIGAGDFHSMSGDESVAYFMGHSSIRRLVNVPGWNPYHTVYSIGEDELPEDIAKDIAGSSLFQSNQQWTGTRDEVWSSYDGEFGRLYLIAPRYNPNSANPAATGQEIWVYVEGSGWHKWIMPTSMSMSYITHGGVRTSAAVTQGNSRITLLGGTGVDNYRYVYYLDEDYSPGAAPSARDVDSTGVQSVDIPAQWCTPRVRIYQESMDDVVPWVSIFGSQAGGSGIRVFYRMDDDTTWKQCGGAGQVYLLHEHGTKIPVRSRGRSIQLLIEFMSDTVQPRLDAIEIAYKPTNFRGQDATR